MNCIYIAKDEAKELRKDILPIFNDVNTILKDKKKPGFSASVVGSSQRNMIIKRGNSEIDTDFQLNFYGKAAKDLKPNFKLDVYDAFKDAFPSNDWKITISTSVLTIVKVKDGKKDKSYDLAIIKHLENNSLICKGKKDDETSSDNFSWAELGKLSDAYKKFKDATQKEIEEIKEKYINKKCPNYTKSKDDQISSSSLFKEAVNEVI